MARQETKRFRLLLVGATGAGKSCTGNTIFLASDEVKGKIFKDGASSHHSTTENEEITREVLKKNVTIVDSPGLANEGENSKEVINEIRTAIENSTEPYDALLFVVNIFKNGLVMDDFTLEVMENISHQVSKDFWSYAVIVFTYEDNFWELQKKERGDDYEQFSVVEYVNKSTVSGKKYAIGRVIQKCGIKAVASINNMETDREKIKKKVEELFQEVEFIRRKNNYCRFGKEQLNRQCIVM